MAEQNESVKSLGERILADLEDREKKRQIVVTIVMPLMKGWKLEDALDALEYSSKQLRKCAVL